MNESHKSKKQKLKDIEEESQEDQDSFSREIERDRFEEQILLINLIIDKLQTDNKKLKENNEQLNALVSSLKKENEQLKGEIDLLKKELQKLKH